MTAVEEAQEILDRIDRDLLDSGEFRTLYISQDKEKSIGSIRGADGQPVIGPHPESASMLEGRQVYFDLIVNAPRILRELVDLAENRAKSVESLKNEANF